MRLMLIAAAGGLTACTPTPAAEQPVNAAPAPADNYTVGGPDDPIKIGCNAAKAQSLVGRTADAAAQAEALRLTGAKTLRVLPPGAMMTMDFRSDRLNIKTDGSNKILSFDCG